MRTAHLEKQLIMDLHQQVRPPACPLRQLRVLLVPLLEYAVQPDHGLLCQVSR